MKITGGAPLASLTYITDALFDIFYLSKWTYKDIEKVVLDRSFI